MLKVFKKFDSIGWGCSLLSFVLYLNTLESGFVYDDRRAILSNTDVGGNMAWQNVFKNDFWGTPLTDSGSHGSFRPLCVLSYRLNYLLGGYTPWGFHLVNNLLHCFVTFLVVKVARQFLSTYSGVLITGVLFAIHPIHTEAVASIVGRADLGASIFYLLSFLSYLQHIKWRECGDQKQWLALLLVIVLSFLALLFKETAITALLLCGLFDIFRNFINLPKDKQRMRSLVVLALTVIGKLVFRLYLLPRPQTPFSKADNPIARSDCVWTRFYTFLYLPVFSFQLVIYPNILSFDWGMDSIPKITSLSDGRNLLSLAFYGPIVAAIIYCCRVLTKRNGNQNDSKFKYQKQAIKKQQMKQQQQQLISTNTNTPYYAQQQLHRKSRTKKKQKGSVAVQKPNNPLPPTNNTKVTKRNSNSNSNSKPDEAPEMCGDCKHEINDEIHTSSCRNLNNNNIVANIYGDCCCQLLSSSDKNSKRFFSRFFNKISGSISKTKRTRRNSNSSTASSKKTTLSSASSCNSLSSAASSLSGSSRTSVSSNSSSISNRPTHHHQCNHQMMIQQVPMKSQNALVLLMSIGFLTIPFLPASNLFFYVGFVVAERLLYLPSIGFCLLLGMGCSKLLDRFTKIQKEKKRRIAKAALIVIMLIISIILGIRTIKRNNDWKNEENLYRSAIPVNPPKALANLGSILSSQGRFEEARTMLTEALKYRPNMADVHFNLGILHQNQQKFETAVEWFQRAIHFRPNLAVAYLNMGISLMAMGKLQQAAHIWHEGTKLDGKGVRDRMSHDNARISSYLQLGSFYTQQNKLQRALAVYREALHTLPTTYFQRDVLYQRIGELFSRLHQWDEAEKHQRLALEMQPDQIAAHLSYGITLARNSSRASEAELWFKRALRLAPEQASAHHHYAEFLTAQSRLKEAIFYRVRAAELSPDDYSLVVTTATALRLLDRFAEAENWYRKALDLRPNDSHAHTNLGAILHLLGKTGKAAACYREALRIDPYDSTTLANLAKLQNSRKI